MRSRRTTRELFLIPSHRGGSYTPGMEFRILLFAFLLIPFAGADADENPDSKPDFGQRVIAALPLAKEAEFKTPEAAARGILEGVIADDFDRALRASTIRHTSERVTFEAIAADQRALRPLDARDPSSPISQFYSIAGHIQQLRGIRVTLSGVKPPAGLFTFDDDDEKKNAELIEHAKRALFAKGPLEGVQVKDARKSRDVWEMIKVRKVIADLGATDAAMVEATVAAPDQPNLKFEFLAFKIGSNWLINAIFAPRDH